MTINSSVGSKQTIDMVSDYPPPPSLNDLVLCLCGGLSCVLPTSSIVQGLDLLFLHMRLRGVE